MENFFFFTTLFFIIIANKFVTIACQDYSANNPAFVNFSKISNDKLQNSHGHIIYAAMIFRHGGVTTVETYPTDPYRNYLLPQNFNIISNIEKLFLNKIGQYFKGRYGHLTGNTYNRKNFKINSSHKTCVLISAECLLSGYFPPTLSEIWNTNIYWQPIPVHMIPAYYDNIINFSQSCPLNKNLKEEFYATSPAIKNVCQEYESIFNYIEQNTKLSLSPCNSKKTFLTLRQFLQILEMENLLFNLTLPSWTNTIYPEPLKTLVGRTYLMDVDDFQIKRLTSGPFFQLITSEMKKKAKKNSSIPKMHVFAGQATTYITIRRALNIYDDNFPPFGSTLVFELREKNKENYVTLIFTNSTEKEPYEIEIPGCGAYCTLQKFENITNAFIPQNWQNECKVNNTLNTDQSLNEKLLLDNAPNTQNMYRSTRYICITILLLLRII